MGVEVLSKITNWTDRSTCVLFGDAAGAVVVAAALDAGSPFTTDRSPLKDSIQSPSDVTMNRMALTVVIFDRMVAVPRGPKAV